MSHSSTKKIVKKLPDGKLPIDALMHLLATLAPTKKLVVPPDIGVDVGITKIDGAYLVSSSDPITGSEEMMGWHAVNVSANDVATSGIMPETLNVVSLFPKGTPLSEIKSLMRQISSTAAHLGITVAGGHTEITPGLMKPIIMVTCFGSGDRFVTAAMAKTGDSILMTKTAGIEGTSILARLHRVREMLPDGLRRKGARLIQNLSVVEDARLAFSTGKVHAMHDVTEGGVLGAVVEICLASKLGFELETDKIALDSSTLELSKRLKIDPFKLIGSGSLLIAVPKQHEGRVIDDLTKKGIRCTRIGMFLPLSSGRKLKSAKGTITLEDLSIQDELWPALSKYK